jgi:hypothetical protein
MANANAPFGLKPLRDARSGKESGGLEMFSVPASDGTALYIGDPVVKNGSPLTLLALPAWFVLRLLARSRALSRASSQTA